MEVACEKLPEASPLSDRTSANRLQDGPAAGQGQASHGGSTSGIM